MIPNIDLIIFLNHLYSQYFPSPDEPYPSPSSHTDATSILSPLSSNEPDATSPVTDDQFEHNLDNFTKINNKFTTLFTNWLIQLQIPNPLLPQLTLHPHEPRGFSWYASTLILYINSLLIVHDHTDYVAIILNTLILQIFSIKTYHFPLNILATVPLMKTHIHHTSMKIPHSLHYPGSPIITFLTH